MLVPVNCFHSENQSVFICFISVISGEFFGLSLKSKVRGLVQAQNLSHRIFELIFILQLLVVGYFRVYG